MHSHEQGGFVEVPPFPSLVVGNVNTSWAGRWVYFWAPAVPWPYKQVVQEAVLAEPSAAGSADTPWELPCQADTVLLVKL